MCSGRLMMVTVTSFKSAQTGLPQMIVENPRMSSWPLLCGQNNHHNNNIVYSIVAIHAIDLCEDELRIFAMTMCILLDLLPGEARIT